MTVNGANYVTEVQPSSVHDHYEGILGVYNNNPYAVAGTDSTNVAYFDWRISTWFSENEKFPGGYIQWASTVTFMENMYIFGGYAYPSTLSWGL